jgi:hypothetical protein
MLGRLLIGIVKGLIVGGLVGFGLVQLGMATPGAVLAYLAAALTGVLVGLVAGKPIWAKDAKIEAGMKAFVGALLGAGLMYAARRWLTMPLPPALASLANPSPAEADVAASLGSVGMTSLAAVGAVLGGFYEADNNPNEVEGTPAASGKQAAASGKRVAPQQEELEEEDEAGGEADKKRSKK